MNGLFNQKVRTPIGEGVVQSSFILIIGGPSKYLVRLPVNDETTPHLRDTNCITPNASKSGLWVFLEEELVPNGKKGHWVGGDHVSTD